MPSGNIDVAQLPLYSTSNRTRHCISCCLSHEFNPRNTEDGYYPAYLSALFDLFYFHFNGALTPRVHSNVCLSSAELERRWLAAYHTWGALNPVMDEAHVELDESDDDMELVHDKDYIPTASGTFFLPLHFLSLN